MYDSISESLTSKIISHKEPVFNARGLQPNRTYILSIFSQNQWGTSEKVLQTLSTIQMSPGPGSIDQQVSASTDIKGLLVVQGAGREEQQHISNEASASGSSSSQLGERKRLNSQSYSPVSGSKMEEKPTDLIQVESRTMLKMEEEKGNAIDTQAAVDLPHSGTV